MNWCLGYSYLLMVVHVPSQKWLKVVKSDSEWFNDGYDIWWLQLFNGDIISWKYHGDIYDI